MGDDMFIIKGCNVFPMQIEGVLMKLPEVGDDYRILLETIDDQDEMIVEVEVDTLEQLDQVLPAGPDIILLDNMSLEQLGEAVARRNKINPAVELEASGGVTLSTVRRIADTGIERISIGALTHSASALDFGLDWLK